jgi:(Z)-2-((N-methylformamido)methylene)-5-hydroxybutyrolactone dehydrogenase
MSMEQARFRLFINGSYCDAKSTFASIDSATGEPWAVMPAADEDEVDAAVQAAHRALHSGHIAHGAVRRLRAVGLWT